MPSRSLSTTTTFPAGCKMSYIRTAYEEHKNLAVEVNDVVNITLGKVVEGGMQVVEEALQSDGEVGGWRRRMEASPTGEGREETGCDGGVLEGGEIGMRDGADGGEAVDEVRGIAVVSGEGLEPRSEGLRSQSVEVDGGGPAEEEGRVVAEVHRLIRDDQGLQMSGDF